MSDKLSVLYLSGLFPKEMEASIIEDSKGVIQNAANNLQWELLKGLDLNLGEDKIKVLNLIYIGSYPKRYRKIRVPTMEFKRNPGIKNKDINIGFINLSVYKRFSRKRNLKIHVDEWLVQNKDKLKVVIAYAMTSNFTNTLKYIKKKYPDVITCLIVPDLPQYMNFSNSNSIYRILKKIDMSLIKNDMKYIDSYVLLTEQMANYLEINKPYTVVEGIAPYIKLDNKLNIDKNIILYTGGIDKKYGVLDLVDSFKAVDMENIELYICGTGKDEELLRKKIDSFKNVKYLGQISRNEVLNLQRKAMLLVNPRPDTEAFTAYSFPSKTLEYMASGTPMLGYKLKGMPIEYHSYFYSINEKGLTESLKEVLEIDKAELSRMGIKAKNFVDSNKNCKIQALKIVKMINEIVID